jgi:hypothetical protein
VPNTPYTPTHPAASYVAKKLQLFSGLVDSYARDSKHFIKKLLQIRTVEGHIIVIFNIDPLFTNLPIPKTSLILRNHPQLQTRQPPKGKETPKL